VKSKEELDADLRAYDWLREHPDKYSPLSEKNQPCERIQRGTSRHR